MGALDCPGILGCDLRTSEGMASAEQEGLFDTVCLDAVREAARILEDVIIVARADALVDGEGARVRESASPVAPRFVPFIRLCRESDWPSIWPFLHATVAAGETYAFPPQSSETEMHGAWIDTPRATYVACSPDGRVLGTYYVSPTIRALVPTCVTAASSWHRRRRDRASRRPCARMLNWRPSPWASEPCSSILSSAPIRGPSAFGGGSASPSSARFPALSITSGSASWMPWSCSKNW
jgi:hypothetical protein